MIVFDVWDIPALVLLGLLAVALLVLGAMIGVLTIAEKVKGKGRKREKDS